MDVKYGAIVYLASEYESCEMQRSATWLNVLLLEPVQKPVKDKL